MAWIDLKGYRADKARNMRELVMELARWGTDATGTTMPIHERVAKHVRVHEDTVGRLIKELKAAGWLVQLEASQLAQYDENGTEIRPSQACVYAFTMPPSVDDSRLNVGPQRSCGLGSNKNPYAREISYPQPTASRPGVEIHNRKPLSRPTFDSQRALLRPGSRRYRRFALSEELRKIIPYRSSPIQQVSLRHLMSILRPFADAGWTANDVVHALDWTPDLPNSEGRAWTYTAPARSPGGWLRYRLNFWLDDLGNPWPSRSQIARRRTEESREFRRQQQRLRAAFEAERIHAERVRASRVAELEAAQGDLFALDVDDLANPPELRQQWHWRDNGTA
jgi:hypothetical protein